LARLARTALETVLERLRFDERTVGYIKFDLRRAWTRWRRHRVIVQPGERKLQLGAGRRTMPGWLNCDITGSDHDVDLATMPLPFPDSHFTDIVAQHTIEHLDYDPQVIELFRDCARMLVPGGKVWFSCPDLEKICAAYVADRCATLDRGLKRHWPHAEAPGFPVQHRINFYFHQGGQHRNLLDFEMLEWALREVGFVEVRRGTEADFIADYRDFARRNDDFESIYVTARKPSL
jgi:predicted SAM-dependent methyltransferase